ncbi:hypothetical protein D3C78_1410590 [compost metagenome]
MQQDGEDALALLVARQADDGLHAQVAQGPDGLLAIAAAKELRHLLLGQAYLGQHFVEQVRFVLEMPVDGTTGHPGGAGDLLQRRVRHTVLQE